MFRKWMSCLCIVAVLASGFAGLWTSGRTFAQQAEATPLGTQPGSDAAGHWAEKALRKWQAYGIVSGYPDGSLKPDRQLTRAEFIVMLDRVFRFDGGSGAPFKDVPQTAYYSKALAGAFAAGFAGGTGNGLFMPDRPITREEAAKLVALAFDVEPDTSEAKAPEDGEQIAAWARPSVAAMLGRGYMTGRGLDRFEPKAGMTRAEMIQVLDNVVDRMIGTEGLSDTTVQGNAVVNHAPVRLQNLVVEGDLLLAPGVREGAVSLDHVTVKGRVLVQGSPAAGIAIKDSQLAVVQIAAPKTKLSLAAVKVDRLRMLQSAADSVISQDDATSIGKLDNEALRVEFRQSASQGGTAGLQTGGNGAGSDVPSGQETLPAKVSALAFAQADEEEDADLVATGGGGTTELQTNVGELSDTYEVRYMEGAGSTIAFTLHGLAPNAPATVEIEEIHTRNPEAFAYTVLANGQEVYFRTYREASAGPNHYFIELSAAAVGNASSVTLTLRNETQTRVHFSKVWAYSNYADLLADEQIYRPMTVGLFKPNISWNDYAADLALLNGLKETYANYDMYRISVVFDILYMHWSSAEMKRRLDYLIRLSADSGLPIHLSVDAWWDGTPTGPDGLGGYWRDLPYQQVVYDPLNSDGRGQWKLTTPNVFGNTPWLTMNNAHYNEVREEKIRDVTSYLSQRTGEMKAEGETLPPIVVFTENEPWYWPYFALNPSPQGAGDFGPEVIAAAAADGVTLNPADGLSVQELRWLAKNMTDYISDTAQAMADGYGHNAIVVNNGQVSYPDSQLIENAFTHIFPNAKYPALEENRALWESHMVEAIRYGGEWDDLLDERYLSYIAARGKFADVNAERSAMQDFGFLPQAYAFGADHSTIYNFRSGDDSIVRAADGDIDAPYVTPSYGKVAVDYQFSDELSLTPSATLVEVNHVKRSLLQEHYVASADTADAGGGYLTFKVDNQGVPLSDGLLVDLTGRNLHELCGGCKIEVWAGATLSDLSVAGTVYGFRSTAHVEARDQIDPASDVAYVRIRFYSPSVASLDNWVALSGIQISAALSEASGHMNGFQYTLKQLRERNLWVTYRADVERLLDQYAGQAGQTGVYQTIKEQYDKGYYGSAYRALLAAMSQLLPAKFVVKGYGQLGDYPMSLDAGSPEAVVRATLYEAGDSVRIGLAADAETQVSVTLTGATASHYQAADLGEGQYELKPAQAGDAGAVAVSGGHVTFALTAPGDAVKQYPAAFEAKMYGVSASGESIAIQSQDPEIGEYASAVELKLADGATILRGPEGASDQDLQAVPAEMLEYGDLLRLTLNGDNEITGIKAYYGTVYGAITAIEPIEVNGELRNAYMELRDSQNHVYRFELGQDSQFKSPRATGVSLFMAQIDDWGFKDGDEVTVRYSPYVTSGREKRLLEISETYDSLLNENFEDGSETWRNRAYVVQNVIETRLDSNIQDRVLRPSDISQPGIVEWKFESAAPFTLAAIQYSGRAILGSTVEWEISSSGSSGSWQKVGEIANNSDNNNYNQLRDIKLDLGSMNTSTLYVRVVMSTNTSDTWASLNSMRFTVLQAGARQLDSAVLALGSGAVFTGQDVPLSLSAAYDTGAAVNLEEAKVAYSWDNEAMFVRSAGGVRAVQPGTGTIRAYVSVNGVVVASNSVAVTVAAQALDHFELSTADRMMGLGDTYGIGITVYNDQDYVLHSSLYAATFASSDGAVASVSANGTLTAVAYGSAVITVQVDFENTSLVRTFNVTVARPVALVDEDFQSLPAGPVAAGDIGAYEVVQLQNELLHESLPNMGLTGTPDGAGGKQDGYVIYKLDSTDADGFKKLELLYSGRTLYIDDNRIADIRFYAGTSTSGMTQVGSLPTSAAGNYDTIRSLDLTSVAQGQTTVYLKIDIHAVAYTWGFLNSVKVVDYATEA
ncbi:S-layer homology domain-containing protein [Cohnella hashimotonis]|uniref:S-layer homology domain-containing protein n=1 Tax=Cohnella hashimotonis TaxID=2826895 RepID=A0ABT6TM38_9BACL|nr:S-layer homology domain-containing protein [Cohnella hashimotonis]MDI4647004.1 S-layer homology domain-containing protein [Cohnella hashimotonis]